MKNKKQKRRRNKVRVTRNIYTPVIETSNSDVKIEIFEYNETDFYEWQPHSIEECQKLVDKDCNVWINVESNSSKSAVDKLGEIFKLHPLVIENIGTTNQRPKLENYENYLYIAAKMLIFNQSNDEYIIEHQTIITGKKFVLTFGHKDGDVFETVRERLRKSSGRIRKMGADYLTYCLLDAIIDGYFTVLESIGENMENVEEILLERPSSDIIHDIRQLKSDMLYIHKAIWPLREVISALVRDETEIISDGVQVYMRDIYDHIVQLMDTSDTQRDMMSSMMDIYLSSISNRMNEIMKVLTIMSTLFIPLTFITGAFGMNFDKMPIVHNSNGFYILFVLMLIVSGTMVVYFKRKKWI